jgi:transcriptional regulator with XRE-family HTH domain
MKSVFTDEYKAVLQCLVAVRRRHKMTQQELAARLSKPQSFVSKYEHGERRIDVVEFLQIVRMIGADPQAVIKEIFDAVPHLRARHRKRPTKR